MSEHKTPPPGRKATREEALREINERYADCFRRLANHQGPPGQALESTAAFAGLDDSEMAWLHEHLIELDGVGKLVLQKLVGRIAVDSAPLYHKATQLAGMVQGTMALDGKGLPALDLKRLRMRTLARLHAERAAKALERYPAHEVQP